MGKAISVVAATAAAAAAALSLALGLRRGRKKRTVHGIQAPVNALRSFTSMLSMGSRRPASWYASLPRITLKNNKGMEVEVCAIGCAITKLIVPDAKGRRVDVVLGYDDIEQYVKADPCTYFGVVVGRCANRIANATFSLDGEVHRLLANNGPNALHGGAQGLHKRNWQVQEISGSNFSGVELHYTSAVGEEGYPGELFVTVTYKLAKDCNELTTTISATTDEATPVNITQHSYFNLAGHASGTILDHELIIHGDHYLPVGPTQIPTAEILPVHATPFDFTIPYAIGARIGQVPGGYDHTYVLHNMGPQAKALAKKNGMATDKPKLAATLKDPASGRTLDVFTTAPGLQFYSGNYLNDNAGKGGAKYPLHGGLCLEPQGFPDAVNQPSFPPVILQPDDKYVHEIVYRFTP